MALGLGAQFGGASIVWPAGVFACPLSTIWRTYPMRSAARFSVATAFFSSSVRTMSRVSSAWSEGSSRSR